MSHWKSILKDLTASFVEHDTRIEFLREIDRKILTDISLEDICEFFLGHIVDLAKADFGYLLVNTGVSLSFLKGTSAPGTLGSIELVHDLETILLDQSSVYQQKKSKSNSYIPFIGETSSSRILIPLKHNAELWGLVDLEFSKSLDEKSKDIHELRNFLVIACGQLEVTIRARTQHRELQQLSKIQDELFVKELDITESLQSILDNIIFALPKMGPLKIDPDPEVQILFYNEGDEFLTIKATTGPENLNTRVSVRNSISGYLVENRRFSLYLCDPTDEPERYKSYLGKDEQGSASKEIRTELAVPINFEDQLIGVVNVESENVGAFKLLHIVSLQRLAEKAAPIINALQKRLKKIQNQDKASVYSMKRFLNRSGAVFAHDLKNDRATVKSNLEQIEKHLKQLDGIDITEKLLKNLDRSKEYFERIRIRQNDFFKDLAVYLALGKFSANNIIRGAIKEMYPDELKEKEKIEIIFNPESDYPIFCSPYFKEHIFNLLNNSVYSIRDKQTRIPDFIGKIEIRTDLVTDEVESDINKQCMITVRDNGMGLNRASIDKLTTGGFTTKTSGEGLGVSACFHYLKSVGGKIDIDGKPNEYFKVKMFLDIYDEKLHGKDKGRHELGK